MTQQKVCRLSEDRIDEIDHQLAVRFFLEGVDDYNPHALYEAYRSLFNNKDSERLPRVSRETGIPIEELLEFGWHMFDTLMEHVEEREHEDKQP